MEPHTDHKTSFFQSKTFKGILYGLGVAVILLLTFQAGVYMGYRKAMFSSQWAKNYPGNFFPRPEMRPFGGPGDDHGFVNAHGAFGEIIKVDKTDIVVKGDNEAEKTVMPGSDTVVERDFDKIQFSDLKVGDKVIVFGSPNENGQVLAKLIRILPPLPQPQP